MRKCGPLSEGFSTRISLALTLRLSVLMAPEKPLPVEVNVPMVAIVSFPWFSRAAPIATSMAVVRPEAIDLHPEGRNEWRAAGSDFLGPRGMVRSARGRKSRTHVAGTRSRAREAGSAFGQTSLYRGRRWVRPSGKHME